MRGLDRKTRDASSEFQAVKTMSIHEQGHVFGLVPFERTANVEESFGKHCTNQCSMHQVYGLQDIVRVSTDRMKLGPYCNQCVTDLRSYFK
jgi:predicted Zn-dependent protease